MQSLVLRPSLVPSWQLRSLAARDATTGPEERQRALHTAPRLSVNMQTAILQQLLSELLAVEGIMLVMDNAGAVKTAGLPSRPGTGTCT